MRLRSLLFVPADRPDRFAKAFSSGADAVILDLEDSVAVPNKQKARDEVVHFASAAPAGALLFIRVNPLSSPDYATDVLAVAASRPFGIVLPKCESAANVETIVSDLQAQGSLRTLILPIATETPASIFGLGTYAKVGASLCGLTWGAEDLPAAIGAVSARDVDGRYTPPYDLARSLVLFGAHAAGVSAIETVFPDFRDTEGLRQYAERGRRDGFTGMMAIHPDQVTVINSAFTPIQKDIEWARRVVSAFEVDPGVGVIQLDGRMLDRPHLKVARSILAASAENVEHAKARSIDLGQTVVGQRRD